MNSAAATPCRACTSTPRSTSAAHTASCVESGFAARSDDLGARGSEREHETGGLRLEVDDDRDLATAQRAVRRAARRRAACSTGMCCSRPVDAAVTFRSKREVGDARAAGGSGGGGHRSGEGRT